MTSPDPDVPDVPAAAARSALADHLELLRFELSDVDVTHLGEERDRVVRMLRGVAARTAEPRAPLLVVVGGGSGAGKSTTVNTLAGAQVTVASVVRPTTRTPTLVCHPDDRAWFADDRVLPGLVRLDRDAADTEGAGRGLRLVPSDAIPRGIGLLDTPDIDSVEFANHLLADEALDAADAWVWLATARTYADEVGMAYLRRAASRHAVAAVAVTQLRAEDHAEVCADVDRLLADEGIEPQVRVVVPYGEVADGRLADAAVASLCDWLGELAPTDRRVEVRSRALSGLEAALPDELTPTLGAVERERAAADRLHSLVADRYAAIGARFEGELDAGIPLRADVLERWGALVGGNEALARIQTAIGQVGDIVRARLGRRPAADTRDVQVEVAGELTRIITQLLEHTARLVRRDLEADPAGLRLLDQHAELRQDDDDRETTVRRVVADWELAVSERIEHVGGPRMKQARRRSTALNAVATSAILVLFTLSGGLTGGEVGIAAVAAAGSQWLLVRMLGEKNVRMLIDEIGADLTRRVVELATVDRDRVDAAITSARPPDGVVDALRAAGASS